MRRMWACVKILLGLGAMILMIAVVFGYENKPDRHIVYIIAYFGVSILGALCGLALAWDGVKKLRRAG